MKKVAVIGLYSIPNMGDKILCEASQFLIKEINPEVEIVEVDACPRYGQDYRGFEHTKYRMSRTMKIVGDKLFSYENGGKFRYAYEYLMWWLRLHRHYERSLAGVDAVVFAGGGFIKFRTQGLNYYVEMIVKIAAKMNIPVMFNGVGVEGYDESDIRCQQLKKVLNHEVVKVITTRDDIDTLKNSYLTNPAISSSNVGDPAFWIPECYDVSRGEPNGVIGINIIRGKIFQSYGNSLSQQQLFNFYRGLLAEAERRGKNWVLFSNGMKSDQVFGRQLLKSMNLDVKEHLLPAPKTSLDLINIIRDFDCILGARLHAMITAYSLDVPVVGLIWNEKIRIFSGMIDKPKNFFEEDELDPAKVFDALEKSIGDKYDVGMRNDYKQLTYQYVAEFMGHVVTQEL